MKVIKNFIKLKSSDYYRKKYYNSQIKDRTWGSDVYEEVLSD